MVTLSADKGGRGDLPADKEGLCILAEPGRACLGGRFS